MKAGSLKLRLLIAASLSILAALILIGCLLVRVFENHVRNRMASDLNHQMDQLAALVVPSASGSVTVDGEMTDPRFDQPLGGLYWQIDHEGKPIARSRSLWDTPLVLPAKVLGAGTQIVEMQGPGGAAVLAGIRDVSLRSPSDSQKRQALRLAVAVDLAELATESAGLMKTLSLGLLIAFAGLVAAAWTQVQFGLRPLEAVRRELEKIRNGTSRSLETTGFPSEVLPLATEINRFLTVQRDTIERARRRAGDLAHGLKTPLAAMAAQADELKVSGQDAAALALGANIELMRRHIERQLALSRSQGGQSVLGATIKSAGDHADAAIAVLRKLPRDRPLTFSLQGQHDLAVHMDAEDFDEVIGNLLDNARKWARERVVVILSEQPNGVSVRVCDDGPGIDEADVVTALQRGKRLDERVQGTGLGLSIAQAILESYGSELNLQRAELGGLEARFIIHWKRDQSHSLDPDV